MNFRIRFYVDFSVRVDSYGGNIGPLHWWNSVTTFTPDPFHLGRFYTAWGAVAWNPIPGVIYREAAIVQDFIPTYPNQLPSRYTFWDRLS